MASSSYTAIGGSRLTARDGTIYWTEADPDASGLHRIISASSRGKQPVVRGIPLPPARMRGLAATEAELVWHDGAMLRVAVSGAVAHVEEPGLAWLTCLVADRHAAYFARAAEGEGSVIGRLVGGVTQQITSVPGTIDQLIIAGEFLAWTLHGKSDVYVQRGGRTAALAYSANEPFALCAAGNEHLLLAVGQKLLRLALATNAVDEMADKLAPGWPHAVTWHAGVAYIARHETVVAGARYGACLERVDLAEDGGTIIHSSSADRTIDQLVANDFGAFCLEKLRGSTDVAITHCTPGPVERSVTEQRAARTGGGIRIDAQFGKLRAGFTSEVSSCAELVARIAKDQPRRLEILCAPASPGELFSSAFVGHPVPSVTSFLAPNPGSLGQLADYLTAMPALERAYIVGDLALEAFEHAALFEVHLESDTMKPTFAAALQRSKLDALERCAFAFKRSSTAQLLKLVEALLMMSAPKLKEVHFGGLRGPDQIRDVTTYLAERRAGVPWELVSFNGALGGEDAWLDVCESIKPPATLKVALPLGDMLSEETQKAQQRRHRWLVDVASLAWSPCDVRATANW
ncbi:MAG: hypothetical protein QM831_06630 [Kofleriaceae bacterium]